MLLEELWNSCRSRIKVLSAKTGRPLCFAFNAKQHQHLANEEVLDIWAKIEATEDCFGNLARPVICVYIAEPKARDEE